MDEQIFHFVDSEPGFSVDFETPPSMGFDRSKLPEASLAGFLSRPVKIFTEDWVEGTALNSVHAPWQEYFTHPVIKKKIDNYSLIRCNLRVKVVISASPFYYGLGMLSYNPKPFNHSHDNTFGQDVFVPRSQRPKVFFTPQNSQGGDLLLPFFHQDVWLSINDTNLSGMGFLAMQSPNQLRNANGVAGGNVTVNVYAWAENVELSGPTVTLQARKSKVGYKKKTGGKSTNSQVMDKIIDFGSAKDEYGQGPVSGIASAVAAAGNALSNVPIIGPFARATEIGAGAASRVAAWFGFTNVPVISNVMPYKDLPFGGIASSEISGPTPKLTLDPKNELTLDSRVVGLDGTDELSLKSYLGRESFLNTFEWTTTDAPDDPLWTCINIPGGLIFKDDQTSLDISPTPLSHISSLYQYWSGTIIYRFKIICSQYHRGRIKIVFEPKSIENVATFSDSTNITRMYDISDNTDFEICVPWMQSAAYHPNHVPGATAAGNRMSYDSGNGTFLPIFSNANGVIKVYVANELSAPSVTAPVTIAVFVRAGDDFELMGPRNPPNNLEWALQSKTTKPEEGDFCDMLGDTSSDVADINLVYGGESAVSLRQLLHRHCYHRTGHVTDVSENTFYSSEQYMYPLSLNTQDDIRNIHPSGTERYNYVCNTFLSWLIPTFAGVRGSTYWAINPTSIDPAKVVFNRMPQLSATSVSPTSYDVLKNVGGSTSAAYSRYSITEPNVRQSGAGSALYNTATQAGATVLVPYISNRKFSSTHPSPFFPGTTSLRDTNEGLNFSTNVAEVGGAILDVDFYTAAGPDFNLFFFSGIPPMRVVTSLPPAV